MPRKSSSKVDQMMQLSETKTESNQFYGRLELLKCLVEFSKLSERVGKLKSYNRYKQVILFDVPISTFWNSIEQFKGTNQKQNERNFQIGQTNLWIHFVFDKKNDLANKGSSQISEWSLWYRPQISKKVLFCISSS